MEPLHQNVTVTMKNSLMNIPLKGKVYSTKPIEDNDLIVALFEEIEISVLCEYFEDEINLNHMILLNITVSETTLYIRVRLHIEHGDCTHQTIYTKWINYSVGLGVNKLRYTIDSLVYKQLHLTRQHKKVPQITDTGVNSVRFNVVRLLSDIVVNKSELKVCIMEQNCLHWIDRSRPCGLQEVKSIFKPKDYPLIDEWNKSGGWLVFQAYIQDLCSKNCSPHQCINSKELQITHSAWFIPCSSCNQAKYEVNCDWSIALWYEPNNQLYPCLYNKRMIQNDQQLLTTYLKDRVLLFLGDSTLRGLMYSLLFRLNKTLFNVYETHKQITLIHSGTKLTRFTYFPNYDLNSINTQSINHHSFIDLLKSLFIFRQTFNEALLFVGGVRWLNSYHLNVIHNFINNQKVFRSIKVFIKDYSAGFHTPIDGLPFINWVDDVL
ncbi:hypothetical protein MN116_005409 [Schistosoma mekongi]|uniref:Uncharacterized protein n=1 Tax=Schistosoma mekongi TaxID=38744 RepID=A0AAE1ZEM7_SCHME|nr:hypothetical protein MN116_005409 [Schistosoma mekongi]